MRPSLSSSPGLVVCRMNTSSSRTDSRITTEVSWLEYLKTDMSRRSTPSLVGGVSFGGCMRGRVYLSATIFASSGWLLPVRSLMEFDVIVGGVVSVCLG